MEWMVAPSYQHATIIEVNEEEHKALIEEDCDRCSGNGYFALGTHNGHPVLSPYDGGVCYKCMGTKKLTKWVRAYDPKEYQAYLKAQERTKERKEAEKENRRKEAEAASEKNKKIFLCENGYDVDSPMVYVVYNTRGGSTYEIKDTLKEEGCKYNPALNWYCAYKINLPEGFALMEVPFDSVFDWKPLVKKAFIKEEGAENVQTLIKERLPKSNSEYMGEIKERLRNLDVIVTGCREIDSAYGLFYLYTFLFGENVLIWKTSVEKTLSIGQHVALTGTVKEHKEYNGVKQTVLNRCLLK